MLNYMPKEYMIMSSNIAGRECRSVFHLYANHARPDTHIIKELIHYEDGRKEKNLRIINNFKRPYWVTKEHYRNHKQKKESEDLDKLLEGSCTESNLATEIATRLGSMYAGVRDLRSIKRSPYVYGIDVNSRTYIKNIYQEKYPDIVTPYEVCVLDIENDTLTGDISMISIATKEKMYTVVNKEYLIKKAVSDKSLDRMITELTTKLEYLYDKYVPKTELTKNIKRTYSIATNPIEVIKDVFKMAHEWKPDFMTGWNVSYDIEVILKEIKKNNIDPVDIFCDPDLPAKYKHFKYKEGQTQKVTASGKYKPVNPEEQWHTIDAPASFYWIDAMAGHRYVRVGGKTIAGGYSLDNVLKHDLGEKLGKLKFTDEVGGNLKGVEWHQYMVDNKPLEYITYNQWDILSILVLDDHTKDLQQVIPMLSGISNFDIFNSGPKRIIDALHFFYLENKKVLSVKNPVVEDSNLLGLGDWIVLLPSYRISDHGVDVLKESGAASNVRMFVYDSDQVSGYPSNTQAANVSIDTTVREISSISGISKDTFRINNINLLFGKVNSLRYGEEMLKLPNLLEIADMLEK